MKYTKIPLLLEGGVALAGVVGEYYAEQLQTKKSLHREMQAHIFNDKILSSNWKYNYSATQPPHTCDIASFTSSTLCGIGQYSCLLETN